MTLPMHCWPIEERRAYFRRAWHRWKEKKKAKNTMTTNRNHACTPCSDGLYLLTWQQPFGRHYEERSRIVDFKTAQRWANVNGVVFAGKVERKVGV